MDRELSSLPGCPLQYSTRPPEYLNSPTTIAVLQARDFVDVPRGPSEGTNSAYLCNSQGALV